ncbi:flagellar brake protein [Dechloromonas sp.]|uniref:flagellar brake protein n=1 Tax=Dechloromonas sp. TaxID=1917218 RepID=UPI00263F9770|nr:flagellar brake protein [Dechloromonas sp.]
MALEEQPTFLKVSGTDVEVGKPLPHNLYDGNRKLLLKRGYVIESEKQCEILIERGLYRNLSERTSVSGPNVQDEPLPSRETVTTLDAAKLRIGDPLILQATGDAPRLAVRVIGYLKNKGLITTVPEANGEYVMLKDGLTFVARFFSGKNAFAFTIVLNRQTSVPFPHVYFSYPREVRGVEIRKGERVDVELIAAITSAEGNGVASGKIINLSKGGLALRAKAPLGQVGDVIHVKFKITVNDIQSYVDFSCVIRAVSQDGADPAMPSMHGLQFLEADSAMQMTLLAFIYQKMAEN